jgi:alkaline phosphatase D
MIYPRSDAEAERIYQQLKIKSDAFTVYRRSRMPAGLHDRSNPRSGDPIVIANGPYIIRARSSSDPNGGRALPVGMHGYDARTMKSMRAYFLAVGPDIRPGSALEPFENINIYPLIAQILQLKAPHIDGSAEVLSGILVHSH